MFVTYVTYVFYIKYIKYIKCMLCMLCIQTGDSARAPGTACGGDRYMGSNRPRRGGRGLGCPMTGDSARPPGTACGGRTAFYCRSGPS